MQPQVQANYIWLVHLPLLLFAGLIIYSAAPHLAPSVPQKMAEITAVALPSRLGEFLPKPVETLRFIAWITFLPVLTTVIAASSTKFFQTQLGATLSGRVASSLAIALQTILFAFLAFNFVYEQKYGTGLWNKWALMRIAVVSVSLWFLFRKNYTTQAPSARMPLIGKLASGPWLTLIALLLIFWELLPSLNTDQFYPGIIIENRWHLPFYMDEYAAALNGKTLRFDYLPQYVMLLPYLAKPLFLLFGYSVTSFSFVMAFFSSIGLLAVYRTLRLITRNQFQSIFLFALFLGIVCFQCRGRDFGADLYYQKYYTLGMFAQSPGRLFGVWIAMYLLARYTFRPTLARLTVLGVFCGAAALNNPDNGVCALIAAGVTIFFLQVSKPLDALKSAVIYALLTLVPVIVIVILIAYTKGALPNWQEALTYERAGLLGLFSLPTPQWGFYWIPIITFFAAIVRSTQAFFSDPDLKHTPASDSAQMRALYGILLFSGITGLGAMARYMTRSHSDVLQSYFSYWAIPILIFFSLYFFRKREESRIYFIPKVLILAVVSAYLVQFLSLPNIHGNIERLRSTVVANKPVDQLNVHEFASVISNKVIPGSKVFVIYPHAEWISYLAKVENVFPYCQDQCLVMKSQLDKLRQILLNENIQWIFGNAGIEARALFEQLGYRLERSELEGVYIWSKALK